MDPRDALPHAHGAIVLCTEVDTQCDKLADGRPRV